MLEQPGDTTGEAFRGLQAGGPPKGPDFAGAKDAVHGEPEPGSIVAAAFGGGGRDAVVDALTREAEGRAGGGIQRGISRIFERVSGGVKLGAEKASHLTSAIVSRASKVTVFGQNLTSSLDYALHHKKDIVFHAVASTVGGGVAGGLGKAAVRAALAGTGGFLATAAIGAVGGAAAGGVTEYIRQRQGIQISEVNEAEKALIIGGLKREFRRIRAADRNKIGKAALRGAVFGAIGGVIGAEIADNEWVQEQLSKVRLPGMELPKINLPEVKMPQIKLPEVKLPQFQVGTGEPYTPPGMEPEFPAAEPIAPPAVISAPTVEPAPEVTVTPPVSPTAIPTEVSPPAAPAPELAPAPPVPHPPAPEPPTGPSRVLVPTAPTAPEMPAAPAETSPMAPTPPPVSPESAPVPAGTELAIDQSVVPPTEPVALVEPPPAVLPIPVELSVLPEQLPLPAGSNPWEVTSNYLHDFLGRDPTNAEILQITKEVCRQSDISVPDWGVTGEIDHRALPLNYKLVFNDPVKKLIAGMKG